VIERRRIELARQVGRAQNRLQLRPEIQPAAGFGIVDRLDADPVARDQHRAIPPIPDRQPEHPAQPADRRLAPLLVGVHDGLGVGVRVEAVAGRFERRAQLAVVVDLAVEDDPDRPVFVVDRLMAGRQIDDAEPPHADAGPLFNQETLVVRAAMPDGVAHRVDERAPGVGMKRRDHASRLDEPGDAAH
jgi:hypothetical protein